MQPGSARSSEHDFSSDADDGVNLIGEHVFNTHHRSFEGGDDHDEETQMRMQMQMHSSVGPQHSHPSESSFLLSTTTDASTEGGAFLSAGSDSATETIKTSNGSGIVYQAVLIHNNARNLGAAAASAPVSSHYGAVGSMSSSNSGRKITKAMSESSTSSLENSEDEFYKFNGNMKKHSRSIQRNTFDALKEGGKLIVEDDSRDLSLLLLLVVLTCSFSITWLATVNVNNFDSLHKGGGDGVGGRNNIDSLMKYFPFPDGKQLTFNEDGSEPFETSRYVPFATVDRADYSAPASDILSPELFHYSLKHAADQGANLTGTPGPKPFLKVPMPTGAFWTNLVVQPSPDRGLSDTIMAYPYGYKWNENLMQVSYPPLRRIIDNQSVRDIMNADLTFSSKENVAKRNIVRWDPLSVTLRYYGGESANKDEIGKDDGRPDAQIPYWESYLVQGQPYITVKYNEMTPVIEPLTTFTNFVCPRDADGKYKDDASDNSSRDYKTFFGVCSPKMPSHVGTSTLEGVQFLLKTSDNITWMLFASKPVTLTLGPRNLVSVGKFSGLLRFAIVPPPLEKDGGAVKKQDGKYESFPLSQSTAVKRLIYHAHTYPIGATVTWDFKDIPPSPSFNMMSRGKKEFVNDANGFGTLESGVTIGSVKFLFDTKSMQENVNVGRGSQSIPQDSLLMLALPHHAQVLPSNMILEDFDMKFQSIKGTMTPIIGSKWNYDERLTRDGFEDNNSLDRLKSMDPNIKKFILNQVDNDLKIILPNMQEDVYGFGKQVARLANLAHIASVLEDPFPKASNATAPPLTGRATELLHGFLSKFLDSLNEDSLVYDLNFGGIITKKGLLNHEADFGNGWYNDHHFHYGYILYACAFLGRLNSTFVDHYGIHVDSMMYDVAHAANTNSDVKGEAFFPFTRHKSWFDGHSFASGLFRYSNGKSQESSSEAVNCYYGAYLWSLIRWKDADGGQERINFSKLLLAMEIRGAKTYWHMLPPGDADGVDSIHSKTIYSDSISKSLMIGNLGMTDATVSTWFGNKILYVHMINFMPVTAITKELFTLGYVKKEFNKTLKPIYDTVEKAWRGYVISDKAIFEPNQAWQDATQLKSNELDAALSLSQLYYWIASIENFNISTTINFNQTTNVDSSGGEASCVNHKACSGLQGLCCPTASGSNLDCCNQ